MDLNDPRLQQAHKEMAERVKKLDDLIVTTPQVSRQCRELDGRID